MKPKKNQTQRAKKEILNELNGDMEKDYEYLESLESQLKSVGNYVDFTIELNGTFDGFFVATKATIASFPFCRRLISLDGTHSRGRYLGTMLLACTQDANNNLLLLAYGIVKIEDKEN